MIQSKPRSGLCHLLCCGTQVATSNRQFASAQNWLLVLHAQKGRLHDPPKIGSLAKIGGSGWLDGSVGNRVPFSVPGLVVPVAQSVQALLDATGQIRDAVPPARRVGCSVRRDGVVTPTVDDCDIHFAPRNETMVETTTFLGIYRGIITNQGF